MNGSRGGSVDALPPRLSRVLRLLLEGRSQKQIADLLGLSFHTVQQYAKLLYRRLGVHSRGETGAGGQVMKHVSSRSGRSCGVGAGHHVRFE